MSRAALRRKREILYQIQGGLCAHCGKPMPEIGLGTLRNRATIEHVRPKSEGGTDAWTNLLLAHGRCNHTRGVRALTRRAMEVKRYVEVAIAARKDTSWGA